MFLMIHLQFYPIFSSAVDTCFFLLQLYLHKRLLWSKVVLVRPVLQLIVISLSVLTCVSRVSDYKHHWSDVLAGGLLGVVLAVFSVGHLL